MRTIMNRKKREKVSLVPKPVHPTAVRMHGLLGATYVRQHGIVELNWGNSSLTDEFKGMGDLLARRLIFKKLEAEEERKEYFSAHRQLRRQCRDGRTKLQNTLHGDNTAKIRNFLINHRDMQRLYQKMPIYQVVDNINQRTFVMRKERDRLQCRLEQLKQKYEKGLMDRANVENRTKYHDEYVLEEEIKARDFLKKIAKSHVRLNAVKTINGTYNKMLHILRHDAIFYEPILRSLSKDIEDQANFIKYILYIGMPAIAKFAELNFEYRKMEDNMRKSITKKQQALSVYHKVSTPAEVPKKGDAADPLAGASRYVRETKSMNMLVAELATIENMLKEVKQTTLCSQTKGLFPRIAKQTDNNEVFRKKVEKNMLGHENISNKMKRAEVLEGVLIHNSSDDEVARVKRIKELKELLIEEDLIEEADLTHMKQRANIFVLLRVSLWNLFDIVRHVGTYNRNIKMRYPNSYLLLPLLKFEMFTMRAYPPEVFDENLDEIMHKVIKNITKLMKCYENTLTKEKLKDYVDRYYEEYLEGMQVLASEDEEQHAQEPEFDIFEDHKISVNVPNRKQIKALSAKIVEELSKKED